VADHDQRTVESFQRAFQFLDRSEVEMVGRLVQQQQVRRLDQQARQRDARSLAAAQVRDRTISGNCGSPASSSAVSIRASRAVLCGRRLADGVRRLPPAAFSGKGDRRPIKYALP